MTVSTEKIAGKGKQVLDVGEQVVLVIVVI